MAELTTLARPYAKAAFEYAVEQQALDAWAAALDTAAQVASHDKVCTLLSEPGKSAQAQADALLALCGDAVPPAVGSFLRVLADQARLALLPQVSALFTEMKEAQQRVVDIELTSAYPLTGDVESRLAKALSDRLQCQVKLASQVDKGLLGGVVIRAGDTVIDASLRRRLAKLAEAIQS